MTENKYANMLFDYFNKELDKTAIKLRNRIFSHFRDINFTDEQYKSLQPLIREELDDFIYRLLQSMDNEGSDLPEEFLGFEIKAFGYDENGKVSTMPLRDGAFPDYGDLWEIFKKRKI
jgi:hypothetical protein